MTTAARPTFDPARGGSGRGEKDLSALSKQYSSRDLPGHTKLKYRDQGQNSTDELRSRDFREELEKRERETKQTKGSAVPVARRSVDQGTAAIAGGPSKRQKLDAPQNLDADDPVDSENSDSDSDEDDTAALLAELNKIKQERAADMAKKERSKQQEEEKIRMENILSGNPLLNYSSTAKAEMKVKRRWDDDVVFKNCARSEPEKKANQFVNDSLRSDFHKKFMDKYIK
ncbi:protein CWC15 homolog [Anopheles ziemanni]|uniref:protein CWC15 homolog n=1 Tax=Anopheles coustani TaxID=139045 RepID=UPI002659133F|nr:protein CWC15 homolog [Anopheles coustani]XP_058172394.1 protein CWC15 homolog [Anopheles ziemanni]